MTLSRKEYVMAYNILFTSLYAAGKDEPLRYYYATEGERRLYTDAMLTVEATTKYILSRHHIDEIMILGRQLTFDVGDDQRVLGVDDGKSFYTSDINELSTYSLFRYRLSQFKDDLKTELETINNQLSSEEQAKTEAFIKNFYDKTNAGEDESKFARFFDKLVQDTSLYDELKKELIETVPGAAEKQEIYLSWVKNYLYMNLKDSGKLEILEDNEGAKVRFVPTMVGEAGKLPMDTLMKLGQDIVAEKHDSINMYIALNNDDMTDNFVLLALLDILDTLYGSKFELIKVYTTTNAHYKLAGMIRDDSEGYGMASLVTASRAFLKYGKVDMIVDFWEHSHAKNDQIDKMIYAMRYIDTGLSLCCIGDIEKGIISLRELFMNGFDLSNSDYYSKLFILMSEGIKKDYGRLVTASDAGFIDLVKWAYSKGFYQPCLTIIEAKAPLDMVNRGIFYYCNNENDKDRVTELFARTRNKMKPSEYWKMDDLGHYFVKNYIRLNHPSTTNEYQRENAQDLVAGLDNTNPDIVTAYSACDDRQALEDLLFAYLHIGHVRNKTNHASDSYYKNGTPSTEEKDISAKLIVIQESIQYFIRAYDIVLNKIAGKNPTVVQITTEEVKSKARRLERTNR